MKPLLSLFSALTLPNAEIFDSPKLEAFADDKIYVTENMKFVL